MATIEYEADRLLDKIAQAFAQGQVKRTPPPVKSTYVDVEYTSLGPDAPSVESIQAALQLSYSNAFRQVMGDAQERRDRWDIHVYKHVSAPATIRMGTPSSRGRKGGKIFEAMLGIMQKEFALAANWTAPEPASSPEEVEARRVTYHRSAAPPAHADGRRSLPAGGF